MSLPAPFSILRLQTSLLEFAESAKDLSRGRNARACHFLIELPAGATEEENAKRVAALGKSSRFWQNETLKTPAGQATLMFFEPAIDPIGLSARLGELPEGYRGAAELPERDSRAICEKMTAHAEEIGLAAPGALCRLVITGNHMDHWRELGAFAGQCAAKAERQALVSAAGEALSPAGAAAKQEAAAAARPPMDGARRPKAL